jgi:Tol biopolymer transport system component/DNA-binding winged helix-turn-helix (wHTH) protein
MNARDRVVREHKLFVFRFGEIEVREREFLLVKAGQALPVAPTAFRVLLLLLKNSGKVVSKEEILNAVWNDCSVSDNSLTRSIADLRRLMGDDSREPQYIATVQTVGYRFLCPVEVCEEPSPGEKAPDTEKSLIDTASVAVSSNAPGVATADSSTAKIEVRDTGQAAIERRSRGQRRRSWRILWSTLAACAGCALLAVFLIVLLKPTGSRIGNYKYTPIATDAFCGVWSPDGKAVAYEGLVNGKTQVFLRYLNAPASIQLTHEPQSAWPQGWSSDRIHLIVAEVLHPNRPDLSLYSVPLVGGMPEFIGNYTFWGSGNLSPDGKVFAAWTLVGKDTYGVRVSDPLGSPFRTYTPAPFTTMKFHDAPQIMFSPDGKKILLILDPGTGPEVWLLPFPAGGNPPPHKLHKLGSYGWASWMPDGRHFVISLPAVQNSSSHLWMGNIESADLIPLTSGATNEATPVVDPSGRSVLFDQVTVKFDVVSLSMEDGWAKMLINTGRLENMASWSASQAKLAWVSDRRGPLEIWVREPDGVERPVITEAEFPPGTNRALLNPALSPEGNRIVFEREDSSGTIRLWIASLSGGLPVRLTNAEPDAEFGGSWSPDGSRFVYVQQTLDGKKQLMTIRTSGNVAPAMLRDIGGFTFYIPDWSPAGNWITYRDDYGWHVISSDGKSSKFLGKFETRYLAFAKDGKLLYGILTGEGGADPNRATLFSLDPATLKQKVIKELGKDLQPNSIAYPGYRFSLAPDGKSFVYSTGKVQSDLWILDGLAVPSWVDRIRSWVGK